MLKLLIVCVTVIIVVKILTKKEKVDDIHKNKVIYDKSAIEKKYNEERVKKMDKEIKDRTCPNCNKYNPYNYHSHSAEKLNNQTEAYYDYFECKECGTSWKIKTGIGSR